MNIYIIPIAIVFITLILASYFDLKYGIIPNSLTIFLLIIGIAINSCFSILFHDIIFISSSIISMIFTFLLSYLLWKIKLWGGGDVKIITAIASSIPFQPNIIIFKFFNLTLPSIAKYPFSISIIFNSILISFVFLVIYSIFKNRHIFNINRIFSIFKKNDINLINKFKLFRKNSFNKKYFIKKILICFLFSFIFLIFKNNHINHLNIYFFFILAIGIVFSLIFPILLRFSIAIFKKILKNSYNKEIAIDELEEGMIIEDIQIDDNFLLKSDEFNEEMIMNDYLFENNLQDGNFKLLNDFFNKYSELSNLRFKKVELSEKNKRNNLQKIINKSNIKNNILKNDFNDYKAIQQGLIYFKEKLRDYLIIDNDKTIMNDMEKSKKSKYAYIISLKTAAGISNEDIIFLKKLFKRNSLSSLKIKSGIPFAPSIAIGFLIAIFIGDLCVFALEFLKIFLNSLF